MEEKLMSESGVEKTREDILFRSWNDYHIDLTLIVESIEVLYFMR